MATPFQLILNGVLADNNSIGSATAKLNISRTLSMQTVSRRDKGPDFESNTAIDLDYQHHNSRRLVLT
ncbi:hypothetical protein OIU84_010294 [Salix udensis]|uniref:Uncharacterized protein n=1 Tax=Salix udensis TaxID=889485 RepID=A0AAD6NVQ2_9ROSI|nr:hypothetical protein OIU84_010294 [Salix udensis]